MKLRGRILVDDAWRRVIDTVADARGWPSTREPAKLGEKVARVSEAYNTEGHDAAITLDRNAALAARTEFFFPRDLAKGWGAVRELVRSGLIGNPARPLRVLDLGAGVGAMTWGIAKALAEQPNATRSVEAVLIDGDAEALTIAEALAAERNELDGVSVKIETMRQIAPFSAALVGGPFELIIAGQLLSELDRDVDSEERIKRHVRLIRGWLDGLEPNGSLVIVEPALKDRTRHLHAIRDAIVAAKLATVFAPCLHADNCPALAREEDWCSEDRAIDLPEWLAAVARSAGLRWQGSTFSYLVLRKDEASLTSWAANRTSRFRVVSDRIVTKGKTEFFLCGVTPMDGHAQSGRVRVTRLDRHESSENQAWDDIARGSLIAFDPAPIVKENRGLEARIDAASHVAELDVAGAGAKKEI
ncbi:MAG: small ribosomal subunit Rsm22 family protein [Polyangiaceae bacterium]